MPNLPGRRLAGRPGSLGPGPGLNAVDVVGSLVDSTVPRQAIRVYASDDNGVPVEVWARTAAAPSSASRLYTPTQVTVSWVQPTPVEADNWDVRRADGSFVASVAWNGSGAAPSSLVDTDPRPISGAYTVTATLGGTSAAAVSTPTIDLSAAVQGLNAVWLDPFVQLSWNHPAYGRPDLYEVWRTATLIPWQGPTRTFVNTIAGTATSYNDASPNRGVDNGYEVIPILSGYGGTSSSDSVSVPALAPTLITGTIRTAQVFELPPGGVSGRIKGLTWQTPSGYRTGYEIAWALATADPVYNLNAQTLGPDATSAEGPYDEDPPSSHFVRIRTLAPGGASVWYVGGPY